MLGQLDLFKQYNHLYGQGKIDKKQKQSFTLKEQ